MLLSRQVKRLEDRREQKHFSKSRFLSSCTDRTQSMSEGTNTKILTDRLRLSRDAVSPRVTYALVQESYQELTELG